MAESYPQAPGACLVDAHTASCTTFATSSYTTFNVPVIVFARFSLLSLLTISDNVLNYHQKLTFREALIGTIGPICRRTTQQPASRLFSPSIYVCSGRRPNARLRQKEYPRTSPSQYICNTNSIKAAEEACHTLAQNDLEGVYYIRIPRI
ncbi:hypothetical protein PAXINDRAFT_100338 [Paxillus involutus ATCC 200175]|uniref:Uncharacterized protein n=1 Tax=Paxillus involutus ATCC 200175 TaxID=664439 RepID=A0A0C9SX41_PAXIN|nr:hypothetical protein PAXINDRAFT_100338 [Paxillus involutus ATCC 200175]